jgi:hypothetical protein
MSDDNDALLARVAIDALVAEFAYRIDNDLSETVADLFTEDGWYGREGSERSVGREAIRKAYASRVVRGKRVVRHLFTNLRVTMRSGTEADGSCVLLLFAAEGEPPYPVEPKLVQDYRDVYRRIDGRWLFASRETREVFVSPTFRRVLQLGKS